MTIIGVLILGAIGLAIAATEYLDHIARKKTLEDIEHPDWWYWD